MREQVSDEADLTYDRDQMMEYYLGHLDEFERPARVRWQELMARFSKYPSKEAAGAAIAHMGNQVAAGAPMEQVAQAHSDGTTASKGGLRDWTREGSLVSEQLNQELFGLPIGELSPIIESESGYHILRVMEREPATHTGFVEVQEEIQRKIKGQRTKQQFRSYLSRLRERIPVWTIFDDLQPEGHPPNDDRYLRR
jgi:parvulin-like peptidyl-prolyl isomerase